jgi:hypothetical protein
LPAEPDTSGIHTIPELEEEGWFAFGDMWRDIPCELKFSSALFFECSEL